MSRMYSGKGRTSNRLIGYDYRNEGWYFVTICTDNHREYFGFVDNCHVKLTQMGDIAHQCWQKISSHSNNVQIDTYVIMPNHVHGIIWIQSQKYLRRDTACRVSMLNAPQNGYIIHEPFKFEKFGKPTVGSLSTIMRSYKSAVTRYCHQAGYKHFAWQRNYFDHIIRNKWELNAFRNYILNNPKNYSTCK